MFIAQSIQRILAVFAALALVCSLSVTVALADHSEEEPEVSRATTVHEDDANDDDSHDDDHEDDDHGLKTAITSTDTAQLKAFIALLTQLIELLNKQATLQGVDVHLHDDGAVHLHDEDDANDDDDSHDDDEDHDDDNDSDHDED